MARDQAYHKAENIIKTAQRSKITELTLWYMGLTELPESIGQLRQLKFLYLSHNQLAALPESLEHLMQLQDLNLSDNYLTVLPKLLLQLTQLESLSLSYNKLMVLPEKLGNLSQLQSLDISNNQITALPESLGELKKLQSLNIYRNQLKTLPESLVGLTKLYWLDLRGNPLIPELAAAYKQGLDAVKAYLRAKAAAQIILNEAKLILVGEGEVGKSCLLGALRGDPWEEDRPTTHGIEIKPVKVTDSNNREEITLNGWDFGGQRVYRPTHQLFFSAPAVNLVVWKPREGPQQGFVKEWIKLIKHREPEAKIFVVATHGGPQQRQPDIDRQEFWDLFGKDTVIDFLHIESKPDKKGKRRGIEELKRAIARVASSLPEVGHSVPKSFQDVREALQKTGEAYLPFEHVLAICREHKMDDEVAQLFVTISHRLGHLIHYEHDSTLRDIVVLKPDWLATAISFVLDDEVTRNAHGLVRFTRLGQLWNDTSRVEALRYPANLHKIFLRLMERFDLSYRVADPSPQNAADPQSLIAQLVPDTRPEKDLAKTWPPSVASGDIQQVQICRIVDEKGQSATAEGLFYQLIVRLHKYSLGRANYNDSVHWQRGLVLDNAYNGRAFLEHKSNDIHITVRAPYPERFLAMLTEEVKYLVESFWEGLRCDVTVPCLNPKPCLGLFEVAKLIENKRRNRPEQPCPICNEWQSINQLLLNAPDARPVSTMQLVSDRVVLDEVRGLRRLLLAHHLRDMDRFDQLAAKDKEILSKIDLSYYGLMQALTDEAKEGPRLFSLVPVDRTNFNPREWTSAKFRLTLWCEHSRLPLPSLDGKDSKKGIVEIELTRRWFKKAAPFLKVLTGTLSLVLPVAASGVKLAMDDTAYEAIDEQLDFGKDVIDASLEGSEKISDWLSGSESTALEHGEAIRAQGATLRELHALLKAKDPGFGGLVRVMNKRQEFLWVHPQFEGEY
ncbi:leucine-rich repeat domain-containing protein [candidate division KSB1 bacterium]|nr:leucine-rich repeat domain-containing protein [bacterium]NUM68318.1 leucine-rich repeat domain-containing protein [candidate division KSB1 bacterium]